jgi:hypothetical protein
MSDLPYRSQLTGGLCQTFNGSAVGHIYYDALNSMPLVLQSRTGGIKREFIRIGEQHRLVRTEATRDGKPDAAGADY